MVRRASGRTGTSGRPPAPRGRWRARPGVLRDEPHHELAREWPVLAADVADVLHVDADLFLDLAGNRALEALAVVDESGDERVAARRKPSLAREQAAVSIADQD